FPNAVGIESGHADTVGDLFYSSDAGVAPGVKHVANFELFFFYQSVVAPLISTRARVVNQSFTFDGDRPEVNRRYDDYISRFRRVIVSAVGAGGLIYSPASCYNGIAVGSPDGNSSSGPTVDGRCKPDLVAPGSETSFAAPLVSGAAALLVQAGERQGVYATRAIDARTMKALLINGAVKPDGWTHSPTSPLDPHFGAGVLNVFNSWQQLVGGRHPPTLTETASPAPQHAPQNVVPTFSAATGWDLNDLKSSARADAVSHYLFDFGGGNLIATITWNRNFGHGKINNLDLFLFNAGTGALVAQSGSAVDNVEHVFSQDLPAARYDIEVVKRGGSGVASALERYALAWSFEAP
ncbi:MAG: hypothetical protein QOD99_903, partial [Chthoniobacter sp.]|nr:hypothetical protein [Chthoniobacter sp.]